MKVTLPKDYKNIYTLNQVEQMKMVINFEKEDEETAKGWAEYAINEAIRNDHSSIVEIFKVTAEANLNNRIRDAYGEGTGMADVYIIAIAETTSGFIKVGAYLSDIWQTGTVEYRHHEFIQKYKKEA